MLSVTSNINHMTIYRTQFRRLKTTSITTIHRVLTKPNFANMPNNRKTKLHGMVINIILIHSIQHVTYIHFYLCLEISVFYADFIKPILHIRKARLNPLRSNY